MSSRLSKEAEVYRPLMEGALSEGWHLFRIEDGSFGRKPADIIGIAPNGIGVLLEVKLIHRRLHALDLFPVGMLRFNQVEWLKVYAEKAFSLIGLYYADADEMTLYRVTDRKQLELPAQVRDLIQVALIQNEKGRWVGWNQLL